MSPMACPRLEVLPWTARWCGLVGRRRMNEHFQPWWSGLRWGFIVFLCLCWRRHVVAGESEHEDEAEVSPQLGWPRDDGDGYINRLPVCLPAWPIRDASMIASRPDLIRREVAHSAAAVAPGVCCLRHRRLGHCRRPQRHPRLPTLAQLN